MLIDTIKTDIQNCLKLGNKTGLSHRKVILGEIQRLNTKTPNDDEVISLLKKLRKNTEETLNVVIQTGLNPQSSQEFISVINSYIPQQLSKDQIKEWISLNIDFSQFKNALQAVGVVLKQLGNNTDGNTVKEIIQEMQNAK